MFIGNIVNIVQHSHLYNSFLLITVACIVILLVAILYRDHVGFCVIVTFSSIHKRNGQSSLATYGNETKQGQNWRTSGTPNFFLELWCNFVSLYWEVTSVTWPEVTLSGSIFCACATRSGAISALLGPFDRKWQSHVTGRGHVRKYCTHILLTFHSLIIRFVS